MKQHYKQNVWRALGMMFLCVFTLAIPKASATVPPGETLGLLFNVANGKFYTDNNSSGYYNSDTDVLYNGQADKWAWDPTTSTLTLKGFGWETSAKTALVIEEGDITIRLDAGTQNKFISAPPSTSAESCGITMSRNSLTIEGEGALNAIGRDANNSSYGIYVDGNLTIKEGTITATSGSTQLNSMAIIVSIDMTISGGTISATAGAAGNQSCGMTSKNLTVTGGTITTTSGNAQSYAYGLFPKGNMTLSGGTITATAGSSQDQSYGLYVNQDKDFTIRKGVISATGRSKAFYKQPDFLPPVYQYWTNTEPSAPSGQGIVGATTPFDNISGTYKYVKVEALLEYRSLFFDPIDGIFYTDDNNDRSYTPGELYTDQADKWAWNSTTSTLTLRGFEWDVTGSQALQIVNDDIIINLEAGTVNTFISHTDLGIYASITSNITIEGAGSLNVTGVGYGMYILKDFTINNGAVTVIAKGDTRDSYGIFVLSNFTVNDGTMTATGGNSQASGGSNGIFTPGNLTINGGTVIATGADAQPDLSAGISVMGGLFTISGGTVTATGGDAQNTSYGIRSTGTNLTISGGNVSATGGDTQGNSYGVFSINTNVTDGAIAAIAGNGLNSYGLYVYHNLNFISGTLAAMGKNQALASGGVSYPSEYTYWTNTVAQAPNPMGEGTKSTVTPFVNSGTYKYIKMEYVTPPAVPSYGINFLAFDGTITAYPTGNVTAGTTVELTITPNQGYSLLSIMAHGTIAPYTNVVLDNTGGSYSFVMPDYGVTILATFVNQNQQLVNDVKGLIEAADYSMPQTFANTEADVKAELTDQINSEITSTSYSVTEADITITDFIPAVTGGANGSFNFSVALSIGSASATATKSGTILAESAHPVQSYKISVTQNGSGSVTVSETTAAENEVIAITVTPGSGYSFNGIVEVYKQDDPSQKWTLAATGNVFAFPMPAYAVVIKVVFQKTENQVAVESAVVAVAGGTYSMAQGSASTKEQIRAWLVNTLNNIFGSAEGVVFRSTGSMVGDVTVTEFTAAEAGTEANPSGTDGSFKFNVTMIKGSASETTGGMTGVIKATPYSGTPTSIEDVEASKLHAYVSNGTLHVNGLTVGKPWRVYAISGRLVHMAIAGSTEDKMTLPLRGLYIIATDKETRKVVW